METPFYRFNPEDRNTVYEPAEDSFLLLDTLEDELEEIKRSCPLVCVEIGPGSGIIISALAKSLAAQSGLFIGVDINPHACRMTKRTGELNACQLEVINMNLLKGLASGIVDVLIFNPPYVPTSDRASEQLEEHIEQFKKEGHDLVKSWAGGLDGMVVTNEVLEDLDRILSPSGIFYLLLLKENKPNDVVKRLENGNFCGTLVKERKIRGEHLFVVKVRRKNS